jgi:hypothetical protein
MDQPTFLEEERNRREIRSHTRQSLGKTPHLALAGAHLKNFFKTTGNISLLEHRGTFENLTALFETSETH